MGWGTTYACEGLTYESAHQFVFLQYVGFEVTEFRQSEIRKTYQPMIRAMTE